MWSTRLVAILRPRDRHSASRYGYPMGKRPYCRFAIRSVKRPPGRGRPHDSASLPCLPELQTALATRAGTQPIGVAIRVEPLTSTVISGVIFTVGLQRIKERFP
jgi:hypothetical protein